MKVTINGTRFETQQDRPSLKRPGLTGYTFPPCAIMKKSALWQNAGHASVEVKGNPSLVTACNTPVADGMEIVTDSARAVEAQRFVIKLALSSGNHDCIICEKTGACELQDAAYYLKFEDKDFKKGRLSSQFDDSSAFIRVDHNRVHHVRTVLLRRAIISSSIASSRLSNRGYDVADRLRLQ